MLDRLCIFGKNQLCSFFYKNVSPEIKRKITGAIQNEGMEYLLNCIILDLYVVLRKNLDDFVFNNNRRFFDLIGILTQFLNKDDDY